MTFLSPEQRELGRRTFLKALAGTPALALLGAAAGAKTPLSGGPVRIGIVGVGSQGRALLNHLDPAFADLRAVCDINPAQLARTDEALLKQQRPRARHYVEWRDMLANDAIEAVVIALPLWLHADVTEACLDAGKHVLCEKMMAWDVAGCRRMIAAARRSGRVLEIGYQRRYNPIYRAAYEGIVRPELLGEVYHARMVWHRNGNWRRNGEPPSPAYDPSGWGYPTFEHLLNWRLYWRYSQGLFAELGSHQVNVANWVFGSAPEAVIASGGVHRFRDGREVYDHIYATFEYPGGRTATYSSVESNAFENRYEIFFGTKGTLLIQNENDALLFEEGSGGRATGVQVTPRDAGAAAEASETRPDVSSAAGAGTAVGSQSTERPSAIRIEISQFSSAVRTGSPLACGPEAALDSARACISANESIAKRTRVLLTG
ncbi:MAG TPA: Gfo/Idh/MocA family oxidoreductase [Vicinamibacterales bacterium]|nr:Gfo/Idh/MocA family oxidoreductase [Vicinamibacterales bacterium]